MHMANAVESVVQAVSALEGVYTAPHRFGGVEFKLGNVEIGHIHRNGMVDIPFTRAIRDQLLVEGKADRHHLLADSGWMTFYIRTPEDVDRAIWLYRVSYLQKAARRGVATNVPDLAMSDALRDLVVK
jgi:hypothetical protein